MEYHFQIYNPKDFPEIGKIIICTMKEVPWEIKPRITNSKKYLGKLVDFHDKKKSSRPPGKMAKQHPQAQSLGSSLPPET